MEPHVRYVRSADGTNIATYTIGESEERPPFIYMPVVAGIGGTARDLEAPGLESSLSEVAERRRVWMYDQRGDGLSDRDVTGNSLDAWVNDLEAVAARATDGPFDLCARTFSGPIAIAYAARHPGRVRKLVLWSSIIAGRDFRMPPIWRLTTPLAEEDFAFFVRVRFLHAYGWTETGRRAAERAIESGSAASMNAAWRTIRTLDGSEQLAQVHCPTLVVYNAGNEWIPVETARRIAATVPHARLVAVKTNPSDWPGIFGVSDEAASIMLDFLDEDAPAAAAATGLSEGTAIILFADIVDSTAHTERMGDAAFRGHARNVDGHLRAIIREHGGTVVEGKVLGDGVLGVFTSSARAIECALASHNATLDSPLQLRLGLHAGDVVAEENNVYSGAVNIASRICGLSAPGEVLVSDIVRGLARTSASVTFEDRGEHVLKGVADPQRVYAVRPNV
jgi:class 3 adenylate cyclase